MNNTYISMPMAHQKQNGARRTGNTHCQFLKHDHQAYHNPWPLAHVLTVQRQMLKPFCLPMIELRKMLEPLKPAHKFHTLLAASKNIQAPHTNSQHMYIQSSSMLRYCPVTAGQPHGLQPGQLCVNHCMTACQVTPSSRHQTCLAVATPKRFPGPGQSRPLSLTVYNKQDCCCSDTLVYTQTLDAIRT